MISRILLASTLFVGGCKTVSESSETKESSPYLVRTPVDHVWQEESELCVSRPFHFEREFKARHPDNRWFDNVSYRNAYWLAVFGEITYAEEDVQRRFLVDRNGRQRFDTSHYKFMRCSAGVGNCPRRPSTEAFFAVMHTPRIEIPDPDEIPADVADVLEIEPVPGRASVVEGGPVAILSFRGTEITKLEDLRTDADLRRRRVSDAGATVHEGFAAGVDEVWHLIQEQMEWIRSNDPDLPLWITGHSLGGGLAAIALYRMMKEYPDLNYQGIYTFGSPRVGNQQFLKEWHEMTADLSSWRFVNNQDFVTVIPRVGFYHVTDPRPGEEYSRQTMWINEKGNGYVMPENQNRLAENLIQLLFNNPPTRGLFYVTDHMPFGYARKLELLAYKGSRRVWNEEAEDYVLEGPITRCPEDDRSTHFIEYYQRSLGEPTISP